MQTRVVVRDTDARDAHVPVLGSEGLQATLELDGLPLARGNRSRVVLMAGALRRRLHELSGRSQIVVLQQSLTHSQSTTLCWTATFAGSVLHVECFGGAELTSVRIDRRPISPAVVAPFVAASLIDIEIRSSYGAQPACVAVLLGATLFAPSLQLSPTPIQHARRIRAARSEVTSGLSGKMI